MYQKKLFTNNIFKTNFILIITLLFITSCNKNYVPKKYSINQFYQNNRIGGGAFSDDETKLLVSSDVNQGYLMFMKLILLRGKKYKRHFRTRNPFLPLIIYQAPIIFCIRLIKAVMK